MPRDIQDGEIVDMVTVVDLSGFGLVLKSNLIAMLEELLKRRKEPVGYRLGGKVRMKSSPAVIRTISGIELEDDGAITVEHEHAWEPVV